MKVNEFVEEFKKCFDDKDREELVKTILLGEYVPVEKKTAVAAEIIGKCNYSKGNLQVNSVAMFVSYVESVLQLYTNLELDKINPIKDYDALQEYRIVDFIMACIGDDLEEYRVVFNMCRDDFDKNNYSLHGVVSRLIRMLKKGLNELSEEVRKYVEKYVEENELTK